MNFKIRISVYYSSPNRIDVYKNEKFIDPTNAQYVDGKLSLKDPTDNLEFYKPSLANVSGTNLAVKSEKKVYVTIAGSDAIDLKIAPVVVIKFGLPPITPETFFDSNNLVTNFANLLGIDPSKIRKVEIIREKRVKRQADQLVYVSLTIFDNPLNNLTNNSKDEQIEKNMKEIAANVSNQFSTGQLQQSASSLFGVDLSYMAIERPLSNSTSTEIKKITNLLIVQEASNCREQSPCQIQPILQALDQNVI